MDLDHNQAIRQLLDAWRAGTPESLSRTPKALVMACGEGKEALSLARLGCSVFCVEGNAEQREFVLTGITPDDWPFGEQQPGLFNMPTPAEALKGQQEGLRQSTGRSGEEWLAYAKGFVRSYLLKNEKLFCDDVWEAGLERPASPRAFGAVMKHAKASRWMEEAGESRKSKQAHMAIRVVYRSLIWRRLDANNRSQS